MFRKKTYALRVPGYCQDLCHTQMLETSEDAGIRGKHLNLFKNYLISRLQVVKINNLSGKIFKFLAQGTVLEPVLFSICLNNMLTSPTYG